MSALGYNYSDLNWLTPKGKSLVDMLVSGCTINSMTEIKKDFERIKFSPINECYRPLIELCRSVMEHRGLWMTYKGEKKAWGIFIDLAGGLGAFVFHTLKKYSADYDIIHGTIMSKAPSSLFESSKSNKSIARLHPDIIIKDKNGKIICILDAKYKSTVQHFISTVGCGNRRSLSNGGVSFRILVSPSAKKSNSGLSRSK